MSINSSFRREDYNKKKRKILLIKIGIVFLLFVVVFFSVVMISRLERFRISNVEFVGGLLIAPEDIKLETKNFLSGNYFWFFPRDNIILYPHDNLENFLKDKFKRIDTISVSVINNQTIKITITERGLFALWCSGLPGNGSENDDCYFMDSNGVIFSESPIFSGDAYLKYYGVITNQFPIGASYLSSTEFHNLSQFVDRVRNTSLHPLYLVASADGQFDLILANNAKILFDNKIPFTKSADNLDALLKTLNASTTSTSLNIDYIDLRFGNKLFYKLK